MKENAVLLPTETIKGLGKAARKGEWGSVMSSTFTLRNFTFAVATGGVDVSGIPSRTKSAFRKAAEAAAEAVCDARPKGRSARNLAGNKLTGGQAAEAARQELGILGDLLS